MAISKQEWQEIEDIAAKLGVAEVALKYKQYGHSFPYSSKEKVLERISELRNEIAIKWLSATLDCEVITLGQQNSR